MEWRKQKEFLKRGMSSRSRHKKQITKKTWITIMRPKYQDSNSDTQGGHILEKLNSWVFPETSRAFSSISLCNSRKKNSLKYIFIGDHATYFTFPLSFPRFSAKFKFPRVLPEILTIFQIPWVFKV